VFVPITRLLDRRSEHEDRGQAHEVFAEVAVELLARYGEINLEVCGVQILVFHVAPRTSLTGSA
jgi:hypothetical protein